ILFASLDQKHVAELELYIAELFAKRRAMPIDRKSRHSVALAEVDRLQRLSDKYRVAHNDRLIKSDIFAAEVFVVEIEVRLELVTVARFYGQKVVDLPLDAQRIAPAHTPARTGSVDSRAIPYDAQNGQAEFASKVGVRDLLPNER